MTTYNDKIDRAAAFLVERGGVPEVGIILGSGMSGASDRIEAGHVVPFAQIPGFTSPGVATHPGELVFGLVENKSVVVLRGRIHCYEGYSMTEVAFPTFVLGRMGVRLLITTNLVGGINPVFTKGDFIVIKDHVNMVWQNPLVGMKGHNGHDVFVDMIDAYSPFWRERAHAAADRLKMNLHEGVLAYVIGPNFETTSELRFLKMIGADVVSWSMVPEVVAASYEGMDVLGISCVSDMSNPNSMEPIDLESIFEVGSEKADQLYELIRETLL